MEDQNTKNAADAATADKWEATLVNGTSYTFGGTKYEKGVTKTVDNGTKEALETRAIDFRTVEGRFDDEGTAEVTELPKFKFHRVGDAPAAPRTRTRAAR